MDARAELKDYFVEEGATWSKSPIWKDRHDHQTSTYFIAAKSPSEQQSTESPSVRELLTRLEDNGIVEFATLRQGREAIAFSASPTLKTLDAALRNDPAEAAVEDWLDELFQDLKPDHEFEHTEVVMALLFALRNAHVAYFRQIASVLAASRAAEIGRLSRYARRLLGS